MAPEVRGGAGWGEVLVCVCVCVCRGEVLACVCFGWRYWCMCVLEAGVGLSVLGEVLVCACVGGGIGVC